MRPPPRRRRRRARVTARRRMAAADGPERSGLDRGPRIGWSLLPAVTGPGLTRHPGRNRSSGGRVRMIRPDNPRPAYGRTADHQGSSSLPPAIRRRPAGSGRPPRFACIPLAVKLAVLKESRPGEDRVAIVPEVAAKLAGPGVEVAVESGAGAAARFSDDEFREAGRHRGARRRQHAQRRLDRGPGPAAHPRARSPPCPTGVSTVISFLQPVAAADVVKALAAKGATVYSLDLLPRISRAQSMDALSSQATVAGYRAGLSAAEHLAKFFPDVHDGGRHRPTGQGPGHGGRRGRPAGHRHGQAPGRRGARLRRAGRGQRRGAEPRGHDSSSSTSRPRTAPAATPRSSRRSTWPSSRSCWPPRWRRPTWSSPPHRSPVARHRCW